MGGDGEGNLESSPDQTPGEEEYRSGVRSNLGWNVDRGKARDPIIYYIRTEKSLYTLPPQDEDCCGT